MTDTLTPELRGLIRECAEKFVAGPYSSADAYHRIDRAIRTGWHGDPLNAAREQFDRDVADILAEED